MDTELADERHRSREERGWDDLWPPRPGCGPEPHAASSPPVTATTPVTTTGDPSDVEGRFDLKLAELSNVMETRHAELAAHTTSELDAIRASIEAALVTLGQIEGRSAELVRQLAADVEALRTDLRAAVADQVEARADALEREVAREGALETRLRSGLDQARHALTERVDLIETEVATISGELAPLRTQPAGTPAAEILEDVDRLSTAMVAHGTETAARAELVALEDRASKELASAQSEVHSRLTMLDAAVDAVDAAAGSLDAGLLERVTGMANVAATTALAPVRSDLRAIHEEVAATQKSIRELRRRIRTSLTSRAPTGAGLPSPRRGGPKRAATPPKGAAG